MLPVKSSDWLLPSPPNIEAKPHYLKLSLKQKYGGSGSNNEHWCQCCLRHEDFKKATPAWHSRKWWALRLRPIVWLRARQLDSSMFCAVVMKSMSSHAMRNAVAWFWGGSYTRVVIFKRFFLVCAAPCKAASIAKMIWSCDLLITVYQMRQSW